MDNTGYSGQEVTFSRVRASCLTFCSSGLRSSGFTTSSLLSPVIRLNITVCTRPECQMEGAFQYHMNTQLPTACDRHGGDAPWSLSTCGQQGQSVHSHHSDTQRVDCIKSMAKTAPMPKRYSAVRRTFGVSVLILLPKQKLYVPSSLATNVYLPSDSRSPL
jgi:hypothetical protein